MKKNYLFYQKKILLKIRKNIYSKLMKKIKKKMKILFWKEIDLKMIKRILK